MTEEITNKSVLMPKVVVYLNAGLLGPWTPRPVDNSDRRQLGPWTIRTVDSSDRGILGP
jgi:hypothetical protein